MITLLDILNAVTEKISEAFPERPVYIAQQEQNFQEDCIWVEVPSSSYRRQNIGTGETEVYLTIVCRRPLSPNRKQNPEEGLTDLDTVENLFRIGFLRVKDRALPVNASKGGQNGEESYLDMTVTLRDGVGYNPEEGLDPIEEVNSILHLNAEMEVTP